MDEIELGLVDAFQSGHVPWGRMQQGLGGYTCSTNLSHVRSTDAVQVDVFGQREGATKVSWIGGEGALGVSLNLS